MYCSSTIRTYWILTGIAASIGQRIGLHRDGEKLGLPPFDVEIRQRLCYQIVPLYGRASQFAGIGFLKKPVIFRLARAHIGKSLARSGQPINGTAPWNFADQHGAEKVLSTTESEIEEKFIRYCEALLTHCTFSLTVFFSRF
ncbi:hypothetical protein N7508_007834 [Penicillium antarcticum]|uniref:uncharacterized protein n=1 Tax=Penicillium antarcticum TaxID=416450 RepID=UPI0023A135B7|nr:uncharacterized protein N7508_007834 [Penicillium antarcticum]KAJ5297585.1 hypothetical protein N7508_007834 [Penicillium antarcticum]